MSSANVVQTGCCYIFTNGPNCGDNCGDKTSIKSKTGKFCSKHLKAEKKEKKEELLAYIREQVKGVDKENEDVLKEVFTNVEKKFGYAAMYSFFE